MARLSILDSAFLLLETEASPKHVAGVEVFAPGANTPEPRELLAMMKEVPPEPPFNQKLDSHLLSMPSWIEEPDIDLDWHVRRVALPKPGGTAELMDFVSRVHSTTLDRSRPLWEFYLIEGLEGGKFATYFKIHHAYMDGASLSRRAMATYNKTESDDTITPIWGTRARNKKISKEERSALQPLIEGLKSAGVMAREMPKFGTLAIGHGLKAAGLREDGLLVPFSAPRSSINEKLTPARVASGTQLPLERVKAVAQEAGVTINDVLLSIADGGLMAYLDDIGESPEAPLIAQMPISLRRDGNVSKGNQITIALVELATGERDPITRLHRIHRHSAEVKEEYGRMSEWTATTYTVVLQSLAQLVDVAKADRLVHPLGNIVVSNLVGDKGARYMAGARSVGMYPVSTIAPGLSANITFYTSDGIVNIGLIAGREAIQNAAFVTDNMIRSFEELEAALGIKPPGKKKVRKKGGKKKAAKKKGKKKAVQSG
jgi:WS/DGAT/MGAT family acyltransferase